MTAATHKLPGALFGLPHNLVTPENGAVPLLVKMIGLGLNREEKRKLAAAKSLLPVALARNGGNKISDLDARVLTLYMSPMKRHFSFWGAVDSNSTPKRVAHYSLRAPDLALLREYDPQLHTYAFDEASFIEACPIWPQLSKQLSVRLAKIVEKFDPKELMVWLKIRADLIRWDELDEPDRIKLANAVFAMMSIGLTDWFISDAVARCPELGHYFKELYEAERNPEDPLAPISSDDSAAPSSAAESEQVETDAVANDIEGQWERALDRVTEIALQLKQTPDVTLITELQELCGTLNSLAPELGHAERAAEELYLRNRRSMDDVLNSVSGDPAFDWFDASTAGRLTARWEMARRTCESAEAVEALAADCARARSEGATACEAIRANDEAMHAVATKVAELEDQQESTIPLLQKRALRPQIAELRDRRSGLEEELSMLQDRFLAVFSPAGEAFDLDLDYARMLAQDIGVISAAPTQPSPEEALAETDQAADPASTAEGLIKSLQTAPLPDFPSEPAAIESPVAAEGDGACDASATEQLEAPEAAAAVTAAAIAHARATSASAVDKDAHAPAEDNGYVDKTAPSPAPAPGPFNHAAGEQCRVIWEALAEGRLSLAYQLTRAFEEDDAAPLAPPSSLLACAVLADNVVLPEGAVVAMLSQNYQALLSAQMRADAPETWRTAIALLIASVTLRPLLLAPASGAADMVRNLHLDSRHESVYQLVRMIQEHSERLQGFRLELSTFKGTRTAAAWQQEVDALNRETCEWMEQAQHMTMLFSPSTKVWMHWLKSGGLVHHLLSPVQNGEFGKLEQIKALIAELRQPGNVERKVQHTDRHELGRRRGEDIHARALLQVTGRVDEAVGFARRWVLLVESRPQASDALDRKLSALRVDIAQMRDKVTADLLKPVERDEWQLVRSARLTLQRSLDGLWDLFDPNRPPQSTEPRPEELLGQDLLWVPELDQDERWQPEQRGRGLVQAVQRGRDFFTQAPEAVFEERLRRDDLEGAERLLMVLERQSEVTSTSQLRTTWQQRLEERRAALRRQIDAVRTDAEIGVAYGLITEAERAAFDGKLVEMETSLETVRRFWAAFDTLKDLSDTIAARRKEKTDAVHSRLDELAARGAAKEEVLCVRETLDHGDVLTANELLQRLERGEPLDRQALHGHDRFTTYFPLQANTIDETLDALSATELRTMVRNGENFAGLDFSHIALPQVRQAGDMISAWLATKSRRSADMDALKRLLAALGFDVLALTQGSQIGHRVECELTTVSIEDRTVCPIPYFGSHANGRYRLVCVWQRPAEEDIIKLVGDSTVNRPTILLYFGRLTERKRRDASRLAKLHHRSFLLIDETLMVSLAAEGGSRLAALFEVALPFAYSAPYDATSSVVPSEMFFGRLQELQAIQGQNGRCFIYGGRQLGKTALLRKAEKTFHAPEQSRYAKWIDLRAEGIGVNRAPSEIWLCIARELRSIGLLKADTPEPNPNIKGRVGHFITALKDMLKPSSDCRVLLLLDEADRFFEQDRHADFAETRRLKELMEQTERRFKVVFAGLHNVLRMTENANHPLAHLGEPIKVGPLLEGQEWRDAEDLIRKPFEAAGFEFESRDLITRVLAQTNYYPSLIQLYCTHLLRQMLAALRNDPRLGGPRYVIQARHVDAAYKNAALRDEIRTKFNLTLQLDPRYEVIAYTLAYGALLGRHSVPEGVLARDAKAQVMRWWPDGFANTSDLEFRVLLDEMVGLGVLRETGEGRYALRNPNVLLLLGNKEEIEDVLIKDREPTQEFDPATFRARLAQDPANFKRHPLTFQQLATLTRPINAVTVLAGSRAAGLDDILPFLAASVGDKFLLRLDHATDRGSFKVELDRLKERAENGTTVAVVPAHVPWSHAWVADARDRLARLSSRDKHAHVLFLCDPESAWAAIKSGEDIDWPEVNRMQLSPWQDSFVRQWMEDCGLPNDQALRKKVFEASGFWPHLLYAAGPGGREGTRIAERLESLHQRFSDPTARKGLIATFGLDLADVQAVMRALALLGVEIHEADLAQVAEIDAAMVSKVLRWAGFMGMASPTGEGRWLLNQTVQQLLQAEQEG